MIALEVDNVAEPRLSELVRVGSHIFGHNWPLKAPIWTRIKKVCLLCLGAAFKGTGSQRPTQHEKWRGGTDPLDPRMGGLTPNMLRRAGGWPRHLAILYVARVAESESP